jgi:RNA polymerase-binding transcription factor DksA
MEHELEQLKKKLLGKREEVFHGLLDLGKAWDEMAGPEIEFEEKAQKAELSELFAQLDEREQREIEEIDLALSKIATAGYGICEGCKKTIPPARLEALPATRYCLACSARKEESMKIPPALV